MGASGGQRVLRGGADLQVPKAFHRCSEALVETPSSDVLCLVRGELGLKVEEGSG